jgi:hypothetical protein
LRLAHLGYRTTGGGGDGGRTSALGREPDRRRGGLGAAARQRLQSRNSARSAALRLSLLRAAAGEAGQPSQAGVSRPGTRTLVTFPRGTPAAGAAKPAGGIAFGQPTIAGVAGWGFEPDLRGDPTDPNRIYMSSPDSAGSNTSWI